MNELVLNGMPIVNNLIDINFTSIKPGMQILMLESKELPNTLVKYNNVKVVFLTKCLLDCLYRFEGINTNAEMYEREIDYETDEDEVEYEYEVNDMAYDAKELNICYLVLDEEKQIKIQIDGFNEYNIDWEKDEDDLLYKKMKKIRDIAKSTETYINCEKITNTKYIDKKDETAFETDIIMTVPIKQGYLCYLMHDTIIPNIYGWTKKESMYIIDKGFTKYVELKCVEADIFNRIHELGVSKRSYQFDIIKDVYFPAHHYGIKEYLKDPKLLEKVQETYCKYELPKYKINQYFDVIYEDKEIEFKAYMNEINMYGADTRYSYNLKLGGYTFDKNEPLMSDIRKARSVMSYLKKETLINVYTGKVEKGNDTFDYNLLYEDAGGLIVAMIGKGSRKNDYYTRDYTKLGDVFVTATNDEIKDMKERRIMLDKLTDVLEG